jgi:tetratricopeptide (TPR) repeat protein
LETAEKRAKAAPKDVEAVTRHAHALRADGEAKAAKVLRDALALDPKYPDAVWLAARIALAKKDLDAASRHVSTLLAIGKDGYSVALGRAEIAGARKDAAGERRALEAAAAFDPPQSEPWARLAKLAKASSDGVAERRALEKLAELEQHDGSVYRRLIRVLLDAGEPKQAVEIGRMAVFADMENLGTHAVYGEALEAAGRTTDAVFEYESATLCAAPDEARALAHAHLAKALEKLGRAAAAREHMETAKRLDPKVDVRAR